MRSAALACGAPIVSLVTEEGSPEWRLQKAREREHIVSALAAGLAEPHTVLEVVESAGTPEEAAEALCERLGIGHDQAIAILDSQFRRVSRSERARIENELAVLRSEIASLEAEL
jgi:DNA gyrase/topoisomerase IV subunit A